MKPSTDRPILCGTDFSDNAAHASATAAALARRWERPLVLLHVTDEFNAHAQTPEQLDALLRAADERLQSEAVRLAAGGAEVRGEVLHGAVAERAILDFVEAHPPALLVVSAVSKTAFDRWTLGSVSERIAEAAPAPTLVVRAAAPFEAWLRGERALRVFVAADFSASSDAALRWVAAWCGLGPCEVTLGHVAWPPEERQRLGVRGPTSFTEHDPEVQRVLERDLREKAIAVLGEASVAMEVRASWGRVDIPLVDMARAAQADLLVVGTHQRRGVERWTEGSVSRGVLRHAPMSVACVPAAAAPATGPGLHPCRRVLAAADLGEHGGLAVPYACSVVQEGGAVRLVHVEPRSDRDRAQRRVHAEARLRAHIPREAAARGIAMEVEIVEHEDAARGICQAAETFGADLVCIGAHARPGAAARAMGSVALGVLQQCRRPVLVVWPPVA